MVMCLILVFEQDIQYLVKYMIQRIKSIKVSLLLDLIPSYDKSVSILSENPEDF